MHGTFLSHTWTVTLTKKTTTTMMKKKSEKKTYNITQQIQSSKPKTNTIVAQFTYCSCSYYSNIIVNIWERERQRSERDGESVKKKGGKRNSDAYEIFESFFVLFSNTCFHSSNKHFFLFSISLALFHSSIHTTVSLFSLSRSIFVHSTRTQTPL